MAKPEEFEHGWTDNTNRYPVDAILRKFGFTIHARIRIKGRLISRWFKEGQVYSEQEAIATLKRSQLTESEYKDIQRYKQ